MRKFARLEQADIEFAIARELERIGFEMVGNKGSWKLIKATEKDEKDAIAFECQIEAIVKKKEETK